MKSCSWLHRIESIVFALLGSIPLTLGITLRRWAYRYLFKTFGTLVVVDPHVDFIGSHQIEIGNQVSIASGVRLNCSGKHSKIWLGQRVRLDRGVELKGEKKNASIVIGDRTFIGCYTCISGNGSVQIGNDCLIAPQVGIFPNNHNFIDGTCTIKSQGSTRQAVVIEDDCWIGSGAKILAGVTLGKGSVVGAGAVVTKNIPPYAVAVGVPAKVVSRRRNVPSFAKEVLV